MIIKIGFLKYEKGEDDIYITPCLAFGKYSSPNEKGFGFGFGIKWLRTTFSIRMLFPANRVTGAASQPDRADAT